VDIVFLRVILLDKVYFQRVILYRNTDYVTEVVELRFVVLTTSDRLISNKAMNILKFGDGRS
jgi:hypothetical protein